jgi:integrase
VRSRIELVLRAWAAEQGVRDYYNPAALERLSLPKRGKVKKVEHHAALPFGEIGSFMSKLRQMKGTAARALEFAILTAARTGEVIGARWDEIDLKSNIWSIPAGRMKAEKAHQIPLSHRTREIVMMMQKARIDDAEYVFIGDHPGRPLSNMAMLALLKRMGRDDLTVHGFRSTFRDWAGEKTNYAREVVEHAMAHQLPDAAEAAYARGTLFDKRKKLMQSWASYCDTQVFAVGDKEVHVHLLRIGTAA